MLDFQEIIGCLPSNPYRKPDWRWRLAELICDQALNPHQLEMDERALEALTFYRNTLGHKSVTSAIEFYKTERDTITAWLIYDSNDNLCGELQARILADQGRDVIASRLGIPSRAVEIFEDFFFDVRSRLDHAGWVQHKVLGNVDANNHPSLWKFFGYWAGPDILDILIYKVNIVRGKKAALDDILNECMRNFRFRFVATMAHMPITEEACQEAVRTYVTLAVSGPEGSPGVKREDLQSILDSIRKAVPAPDTGDVDVEELGVDPRLNPNFMSRGLSFQGISFPKLGASQ